MWPINPEPTFTPDESIQYGDQKLRDKAQRDIEYRDKRLMVAAQLISTNGYIDVRDAIFDADKLIKANEELAVPE